MQILIIQCPKMGGNLNCYAVAVVDDVINPEFVHLLELNLSAAQAKQSVCRRGLNAKEAKDSLMRAHRDKKRWQRIYRVFPRKKQLEFVRLMKSGEEWKASEINDR